MRKRLFAGIAALIVGTILFMGYLAYAASREISVRQTDAQMLNLSRAIQTAMERENPADREAFCEAYASEGGVRITLLSPEGSVIADTDAQASGLENHAHRPEVRDAMKDGSGVAQRFSTTEHVNMRYFARKLPSGEILRLSVPVQMLADYSGDVVTYIVYACLLAAALALLFSWILTRSIARPIEEWTVWAREVARDPQNAPPQPKPNKLLSDPLEQIGVRLSGALRELGDANRRMDAVLSGMASGLIAVDEANRIAWMNRQALELFALHRAPDGMDIVAATQQEGLARLLSGGGSIEIVQGGHVLVANTTPLEDATLIWLSDITGAHGLEVQRREFAASASHELKTPLAAIQGAVDSLRAQGVPDEEGCLAVIESEIAWLNALTQDLLTLTKVENMHSDNETESLSIEELLADVKRSLAGVCADKGVALTIEAQPGTVRASYTRMRQLAGNLIGNAVQYNRPGGAVRALASFDSGKLVMTVADTGIGIPQGDLARIFERFYRVDKSRSRAGGGTGLGLSIVKHIVRLYHGTIEVKSSEEGSAFTVVLPIAEEEEHA